jgi:hypothetical protein
VNRRRAAIVNGTNITNTGGIGGGPDLSSRKALWENNCHPGEGASEKQSSSRRRRIEKTIVIPAKARRENNRHPGEGRDPCFGRSGAGSVDSVGARGSRSVG